jgi:hypothetical protein
MKQKIREWAWRYLPAEIVSVIITLLSAGITFELTGNYVTTALAGTWGGNIAYFGYILIADSMHTRKARHSEGKRYTKKDLLGNLKELALEFGIAEVIDSFFIRPALMYYLPILLGNLSLGIFIAKIAADVTFYIPAIISYELRKKHLNKKA